MQGSKLRLLESVFGAKNCIRLSPKTSLCGTPQ